MSRKAKRALWVLCVLFLSTPFVLHRGNFVPAKSLHIKVSAADFSTSTPFRVIRVVDGDTLDVSVRGGEVRLRMIGENTPETVDPRKPVECFGREASARAKALLSGQSVRVELDSTQGFLDKYGRVLAYVYLPDGTSLNKEMIAEGYAHEYTYRYPYKYQTEFKAAERTAREASIGLWGPGVCGN